MGGNWEKPDTQTLVLKSMAFAKVLHSAPSLDFQYMHSANPSVSTHDWQTVTPVLPRVLILRLQISYTTQKSMPDSH